MAVAAAADLRFALDEITREFGRQDPEIRLNVTYGASGNFYSQLLNRAPYDMFLSADLDYPRELEKQGLTLGGSEFRYATGRLAIWTPAGSGGGALPDAAGLRQESIRHIAIANPQHAPYGKAAEAALRSLGVYEAVKDKLVYGENAAQALQFAESGAAEAGILPLSLAVAPPVAAKGKYREIPAGAYPPVEQGGIILKAARDAPAALRFRDYLLGPQAQAILQRYGFHPPR